MTLATLAARNLRANALRSGLTVVGVAVAIVAFLLLRTVIGSWTAAADFAAQDRLGTRHKITFVMGLPLRYADDLRKVPGVKAATFASWFGGVDPRHEREFFATLAVESATFLDVFDEMSVTPAEREQWRGDRQGALVGDVIAKKLGWKVGDRVTLLSPIYGGEWEFHVSGIYAALRKSLDRSQFLFHWEYLNEKAPAGMKDEIGWIITRVDDATRTTQVAAAIDRVFADRDIETLSQSERAMNLSFLGMISAVLKAVDVISIVILAIMMLILGNTIAMGVRERTGQFAVMRAIGFSPAGVATVVVGEALVTGALGGGLGLALAFPIVERGMGRWIEENMGAFFPYFRIPAATAATAVGLAAGLALVASLLPAWRAARVDVVDALRRVG